jgi:hypothetical protein
MIMLYQFYFNQAFHYINYINYIKYNYASQITQARIFLCALRLR